jgi:hypothetical protein
VGVLKAAQVLQEVASGRVLQRSVSGYRQAHNYVAPHVNTAYKHSSQVVRPTLSVIGKQASAARNAINAELQKDRYKGAMRHVNSANAFAAKQWQHVRRAVKNINSSQQVCRSLLQLVTCWDLHALPLLYSRKYIVLYQRSVSCRDTIK